MRRWRPLGWLAVFGLAAVAFAACTSATGDSSTSGSGSSDRTRVVASTDVWGDVARQVGGRYVVVDSIISDPSQDPHSYEPSVRNQLTLSKADVVIENGGGYDDFVTTMLRAARSSARVVDAVRTAHAAPVTGEPNEHVWYDLAAVRQVGAAVAAELAAVDPDHAGAFHANEAVFAGKLRKLEQRAAAIRVAHAGTGVAVTEPVPLYLLQACGLVDRTPARFSDAVENGTGVPVGVLSDALGLVDDHTVALLVYNVQTAGPETIRIIGAARHHDEPVVAVTETLPTGRDYVSWMAHNLTTIEAALA